MDATRFWSKVDVRGPDECWPWTASKQHGGYGQFRAEGKKHKAHRVAWEQTQGPIPAGKHMLHHCDNPSCCNPAHLFIGTNADNIQDKVNKGRQVKGSAHSKAQLDEWLVADMRKRYATGKYTKTKLARMFFVHKMTVHDILTGKHWKHVK